MAYQEVVKSAGRVSGKWFGKLFGFFFIFIFIIIPILYAITISIQARSLEPGFSYIAPKIISPVQTLEQQSNIAIAQQGSYIRTGNFFGDIWKFIVFFWLLLGSIYVIYKWHKILYSIMPSTPFSNNTSAKMTNISLAIVTFLIIQIIFLGAMAAASETTSYWQEVNTPFRSVYAFGRAFPFFISEANSIMDSSTSNIDINISNITEEIINTTESGVVIY